MTTSAPSATTPTRRPAVPVLSRPFKGAIALVVAALLLLGGYGTYARWSSSVDLNGGVVNSGQLKLTNPSAGVWRDVSAGGNGTVIPDIATFKIVPGDTLTYTTTATVRAQGNNLNATIVADPASITGSTDLRTVATVSTSISIGGNTVSAITEANDGNLVTTVVTIAFPFSAENVTQLQNLNLSALKLVLTQNNR